MLTLLHRTLSSITLMLVHAVAVLLLVVAHNILLLAGIKVVVLMLLILDGFCLLLLISLIDQTNTILAELDVAPLLPPDLLLVEGEVSGAGLPGLQLSGLRHQPPLQLHRALARLQARVPLGGGQIFLCVLNIFRYLEVLAHDLAVALARGAHQAPVRQPVLGVGLVSGVITVFLLIRSQSQISFSLVS